MPELPEVEVVRRGLAGHVLNRRIARVEVAHPRAVRRHLEGAADFAGRLTDRTITAARRRGKYLWLELDGYSGGPSGGDAGPAGAGPAAAPPPRESPVSAGHDAHLDRSGAAPLPCRDATHDLSERGTRAHPAEPGDALLAHLGMSGQMLVADPGRPDEKHLRIRVVFDDGGPELRFVDQRTFGGLSLHPLVPASGGDTSGELLPAPVAHIARDPMDPAFSLDDAVAAIRRRRTELKRALLDQTAVSGIGNIYADEALWRARLHGARPTETLTRARGRAVLTAAAEVMDAALAQGGTSFDALYVNVNGASGYFDRSLAAYGQADRPCPRCGTPIRREPFMNRSSFSCPRCQPRPRRS